MNTQSDNRANKYNLYSAQLSMSRETLTSGKVRGGCSFLLNTPLSYLRITLIKFAIPLLKMLETITVNVFRVMLYYFDVSLS